MQLSAVAVTGRVKLKRAVHKTDEQVFSVNGKVASFTFSLVFFSTQLEATEFFNSKRLAQYDSRVELFTAMCECGQRLAAHLPPCWSRKVISCEKDTGRSHWKEIRQGRTNGSACPSAPQQAGISTKRTGEFVKMVARTSQELCTDLVPSSGCIFLPLCLS